MTDPSMDQDIGPVSAIAKRDRSERDAAACRAPRPEAPGRELNCRILPNRGRRAMLFRGFGLSFALALAGVFGLLHLQAGQSGDLVPKLEVDRTAFALGSTADHVQCCGCSAPRSRERHAADHAAR